MYVIYSWHSLYGKKYIKDIHLPKSGKILKYLSCPEAHNCCICLIKQVHLKTIYSVLIFEVFGGFFCFFLCKRDKTLTGEIITEYPF